VWNELVNNFILTEMAIPGEKPVQQQTKESATVSEITTAATG